MAVTVLSVLSIPPRPGTWPGRPEINNLHNKREINLAIVKEKTTSTARDRISWPRLLPSILLILITFVLTTIFIAVMDKLPPTAYVKMVYIWLIFGQLYPFTEVLLLTIMIFCPPLPSLETGDIDEVWKL